MFRVTVRQNVWKYPWSTILIRYRYQFLTMGAVLKSIKEQKGWAFDPCANALAVFMARFRHKARPGWNACNRPSSHQRTIPRPGKYKGSRSMTQEKRIMVHRTSILIVDDHEVVRNGIRSYLETIPDFHVIGEAASGEEALSLVSEYNPGYRLA